MGGVTTVADMPNTRPSVTMPRPLEEKIAILRGRASVDYALYAMTRLSVELAVRNLNGERLAAQELYLTAEVIDASNVERFIAQRRDTADRHEDHGHARADEQAHACVQHAADFRRRDRINPPDAHGFSSGIGPADYHGRHPALANAWPLPSPLPA